VRSMITRTLPDFQWWATVSVGLDSGAGGSQSVDPGFERFSSTLGSGEWEWETQLSGGGRLLVYCN
jgi:hypothetical protein